MLISPVTLEMLIILLLTAIGSPPIVADTARSSYPSSAVIVAL